MSRGALFFVRWILPVGLLVASVVMIIVGGEMVQGAGVAGTLVAVMVWLFNVFMRGSIVSNRERDVEEAAREYFDRHGRWPDDG